MGMTNEEAIRELKAMYEHILPYMSIMGTEAYEMAIKSLEQQLCVHDTCMKCVEFSEFKQQPSEDCISRVTPQQTRWIPVSERLPETDNENSINNYNVLLWVKNKSHPEREPEIYLGKLRHIDGDDGSGNFWGIEIKPCDWIIWGWSYFNEPEVIAWQPLPEPYKAESEDE